MRTVDRGLDTVSGCMQWLYWGFASLFLLGGGLIMLGVAGWFIYSSWQITATGVSGTGTVIDLEESSNEGSVAYSPVIEFTATNDQTYTFTGGAASNPPAYAIGDRVALRYDPANPDNVRIDNPWNLWGWAAILGCGGGLLILIQLGITLMAIIRRRPPDIDI